MLKVGDNIAVERKTGFTTIGIFTEQDDEFIVMQGAVGDNIGKEILVPKSNVDLICVLARPSEKRPTWMEPNSK